MGSFFIGYLDDVPVATGAWRRRTDVQVDGTSQTAEIKRMYVAPRVQRRGLARAMLAHLEDTARAAGAEVMVLETGMRQPEAIALYESSGYTPVPGFGFYRDEPLSRCMARSLLVDAGPGRVGLDQVRRVDGEAMASRKRAGDDPFSRGLPRRDAGHPRGDAAPGVVPNGSRGPWPARPSPSVAR